MNDLINRWNICDSLTIYQAALLLCDSDPNDYQNCEECLSDNLLPKDFNTYFSAIKNAVIMENLKARKFWDTFDKDGFAYAFLENRKKQDLKEGHILKIKDDSEEFVKTILYSETVNWYNTIVKVSDLKNWLKENEWTNNFFFRSTNPFDNYPDKLKIAIKAFETISAAPEEFEGTSTKDKISEWLEKNASEFKLVNKKNKPNQLAIKEISKVCNWDISGGRPKKNK
jgi:hypothetical protein